jgi:hypothetical protein
MKATEAPSLLTGTALRDIASDRMADSIVLDPPFSPGWRSGRTKQMVAFG